MRNKAVELLQRLVEYEIECAYHQPQLYHDPNATVDKQRCECCRLNDEPLCKLELLRLELYRLYIAGQIPHSFKPLIFSCRKR
ncbi:MAG: hypothetical protein QIT35_gp78 [Methanophagales virus PBV299]|uniref:Uncharacterized protein n=1 Tax=Methanophagales virus PBV299 TaxID=2987730 RepID=A0ABY6GLX1_9CAUD|nr:MAG: hypothetical protein QIT35_gp78 [Methanophagales virus PBV299]UYL64874.1 MAG: hypothetical protein OFDIEDLO_00078 [Methanophagales virus PBV299]